jgi:predicted aspartyl protease
MNGTSEENPAMGRVLVEAKIENLDDLFTSSKGQLPLAQVRMVQVNDALVDTVASTLSMPKRFIDQLGLQPVRTRQAQTSAGLASFQVYRAARLTIQGRDCICDVVETADGCPVLIGQIPLESLDFVVDPVGQRLIGNPAHGGEQMLDMF